MHATRLVVLWLVWFLAALLPAQEARVANYSGGAFHGWRRVATDQPVKAGAVKLADGTVAVAGHAYGRDCHVLDLMLDLPAASVAVVPLQPVATVDWKPAALQDWQTGPAKVGGAGLQVVSAAQDGAGWELTLATRVGPMLAVRVWIVAYPGQPWASGEVAVTASNNGVPDMGATIPKDLRLTIDGADVIVFGRSDGLLATGGDWLADGQSRMVPITVVWRSRLSTAMDWTSAGAVATGAITGHGVSTLWPGHGNPRGARTSAELRTMVTTAAARLHGYEAGPLGVAAFSGSTGAQEDQGYVGVECMQGIAGIGAHEARYLTALRQSLRPCTHLEPDGELLRLAQHPQLVFWDGRAHWHTGVSPDQLGKPRGLNVAEAHGWFGPDVEHSFAFTSTLATRLTGSAALQWQRESLARVYLLQWTVADGYSTSQPYAARAVGWEAAHVIDDVDTLRDRALAKLEQDRWLARLDRILLPQLESKAGTVWDPRRDDRLGPGVWWICWQQSVGAYWLDCAGEKFARPDARAMALRAAQRVLADGWKQQSGRWVSAAQVSLDGSQPAPFDESFNLFGMSLAPAVVLRHDPNNEKARAILAQLIATAGDRGSAWLPPEVVR